MTTTDNTAERLEASVKIASGDLDAATIEAIAQWLEARAERLQRMAEMHARDHDYAHAAERAHAREEAKQCAWEIRKLVTGEVV